MYITSRWPDGKPMCKDYQYGGIVMIVGTAHRLAGALLVEKEM
jgi:hypothetical protein